MSGVGRHGIRNYPPSEGCIGQPRNVRFCETGQVARTTGQSVNLAYVDQGYTGERAEKAAKDHAITLEVVKLPEAEKGFVLLPRRWVVERSFAWATRFRRLFKDYERYASTPADLHIVAFVRIMLRNVARLATSQ